MEKKAPSIGPASGPGQFPATRWSLVVNAHEGGEGERDEALAELCGLYWYPLYAFVRRRGYSAHDAEDLTQGFFAALLERQKIGDVAREKGKLRTYLLRSMKNFLADDWDKRSAKKRGGGAVPISIEAAQAEDRYRYEPVDSRSPDVLFERRWALTIMEQAFARLREEYTRAGKEAIYEALKPFLGRSPDKLSYAQAGEKIGISESNARVTAFRMRKQFRALLEEEIAHTVTSEAEVSEELRHFQTVLSGG